MTKYLLPIVLIAFARTTVVAPATAQTPSYTPPPNWDAPPKHPGPGGANTFICADWLSKHAARFNEPGGPGGRDPVTNIYGPTATRGHFGAGNVGCFLTLRHRVGPPETGWFTLGEAPSWSPGPSGLASAAPKAKTPGELLTECIENVPKVSPGMTAKEVLAIVCRPAHINSTVTLNGKREQWVYPDVSHTGRGDQYLYFEDGRVVAVQSNN